MTNSWWIFTRRGAESVRLSRLLTAIAWTLSAMGFKLCFYNFMTKSCPFLFSEFSLSFVECSPLSILVTPRGAFATAHAALGLLCSYDHLWESKQKVRRQDAGTGSDFTGESSRTCFLMHGNTNMSLCLRRLVFGLLSPSTTFCHRVELFAEGQIFGAFFTQLKSWARKGGMSVYCALCSLSF